MAKKIKPSAEKDEDSGAEFPGFDETELPDYDIEAKRWLCRRLELLCEQLEIDNEISASERKQEFEISAREREERIKIGYWAARVAGTVPVVALVILFGVMFFCPGYFFNEMNSAVLIVASFSSMVVIYAFLIRGMFPGIQKNDTNDTDTHPATDETLKAVRSLGGKE